MNAMTITAISTIAITAVVGTASAAISVNPTLLPQGTQTRASLSGEVYSVREPKASTLEDALSKIAGRPTIATFRSTGIDYPDGNNLSMSRTRSLSEYLGIDAPSLVGQDAMLSDIVVKMTGFITVNSPGTYSFLAGGDDGFRVNIGGRRIFNRNEAGNFVVRREEVTFTQAGTYEVEVYSWGNMNGNTGIELFTTLPGGRQGRPGTGWFVVGSGDGTISVVPTPGAAALLGAGMMTAARRRRTA